MRRSEAMTAIMVLTRATELLEERATSARVTSEGILRDLDADPPTPIEELGERAAIAIAQLYVVDEAPLPFAAVVSPKAASEPPRRRGRPPTAAKKHVEPLTSPLTPHLREKLERSLGAGTMTVEALARMSWAAELDASKIEALLCEDPSAFISWDRLLAVPSGTVASRVWGTVAHFDRAVAALTLRCPKSDRAKYTSEALGCSVSAAVDAWARLDPEAT